MHCRQNAEGVRYMVSETFAAQVVMLAIGEQGVTIRSLQNLMRKHAGGDPKALKLINAANRFNLSDKKLAALIRYLRPAVRELVDGGTVVFDDLTRPFHFILDPDAQSGDGVSYLNMDFIRRQWQRQGAHQRIMPGCHGMWRVFRISTPRREEELPPDFYDGDFEVSRALLVVRHLDELKAANLVPEFALHLRGSHPDSGEKPKRIHGHLLPVSNRLYLMGQSYATHDAPYVSTLMWVLDVDLRDGTRDALGLLTNSNFEQIAAPLLCKRVPGSEGITSVSPEFGPTLQEELAHIGVKSASAHSPALTPADIEQLKRMNRRAVLRLS